MCCRHMVQAIILTVSISSIIKLLDRVLSVHDPPLVPEQTCVWPGMCFHNMNHRHWVCFKFSNSFCWLYMIINVFTVTLQYSADRQLVNIVFDKADYIVEVMVNILRKRVWEGGFLWQVIFRLFFQMVCHCWCSNDWESDFRYLV